MKGRADAMNAVQRILGLALGMGLACFGGCESEGDSAPPPDDVHPVRLEARIGGIFGPSYEVVLDGPDAVVYRRNPETFTSYPGTKSEKIAVDEAGWIRFRQALDDARVWSWKREYVDPDVADGTSWSLLAQYGERVVEVRGRNAYPDRERFDRFLQGVGDLAGGNPFR